MKKRLKNLKYEVVLAWDKETGGEAHIGSFPAIRLDMPVEFGGKGRFPCPDELFFSAVGGCLLTTFLYYKKKLRLRLKGLQIPVKGTVDFTGKKGYEITGIEATFKIETDETERAKECAELAKHYCHIARSLEPTIPIKISTKIKHTNKKAEIS